MGEAQLHPFIAERVKPQELPPKSHEPKKEDSEREDQCTEKGLGFVAFSDPHDQEETREAGSANNKAVYIS